MTAAEALAALVKYDETVRANTTSDYDAQQTVLDAIRDEHATIAYELLETACDLGYVDRESDDDRFIELFEPLLVGYASVLADEIAQRRCPHCGRWAALFDAFDR